jgi:two-component system sensor histidine kinase VicK
MREYLYFIFAVSAVIFAASAIVIMLVLSNRGKLVKSLSDATAEIERSKDMAEKTLDVLKEAIVIIGTRGSILYSNDPANNLFKLYAAKNNSFDDIVLHYSDELLSANVFAKAGKTEKLGIGGGTYMARYESSEFAGVEEAMIIILTDITDRQRLDRVQTDFVANASHELKTPIAVIKSYSETLMDLADSSGEQKEFLSIIVAETDRMKRLISNLLRITKLDLGEEKLKEEEINLRELIEFVVGRVRVLSKEKLQQINIVTSGENFVARGDEDALGQVFMNVISNAIKYTSEKGRIDVDIMDKGEALTICVKDNGVGVPQEDLARIFERFYRLDKSRSKQEGGTGLGLAISKQIIERHGGKIVAENNLDSGTKILIDLPTSSPSDEGEENA